MPTVVSGVIIHYTNMLFCTQEDKATFEAGVALQSRTCPSGHLFCLKSSAVKDHM